MWNFNNTFFEWNLNLIKMDFNYDLHNKIIEKQNNKTKQNQIKSNQNGIMKITFFIRFNI